MQRRELLFAAATTAAGIIAAGTGTAALAAPMRRSPPDRRTGGRPFLRVRDWGTGDPVVFLSGWGLPSDFWQYHMVDLAGRGARCVAYDRRGHGRSDDPGTGYDYDTLADDLATVLDQLDLRNVTLVAYSMSGGEAARYLTRHGSKRIARVAFVAATTPFLTRTESNPDGVPAATFDKLRAAMVADFPKWMANGEAAFWSGLVSPEMQAWGRGLMLPASLPALIECNKAVVSTDLRPDLKAIKLPTLVIHGDRDTSAPLALTGLRTSKLVPGAKLSIYEGAPHGLPLTHRERHKRRRTH